MRKLCILFCGFLLCACSAKTYTREEQQLISKAEQIMVYLQNEEYDKIAKEFSILAGPNHKLGSVIKAGWESIPAEYGDFMGVDRYTIIHLKTGSEVKIIANYENYKIQFSISFLSNGKISGLHFR